MHRLWLIGLREFKAYVATISFWIALAIGPILMLAAAGLLAASQQPPATLRIGLAVEDAALRAEASAALTDAVRLMGRPLIIGASGDTSVRIEAAPDGVSATFSGQALPAAARQLFKTDLERRLALRRLVEAGGAADDPSAAAAVQVAMIQPPTAPSAANPEAAARFGLVFMLWLTLTGSLGMLLQAVVRERSNRALDSLLAAAHPVEIVFGKLLGVGAVSLLVIGAWLGTAAALGGLAPAEGVGAMHNALSAFADPRLVIQAVGIYILAFAMYGSATIALGAAAQDSASAQNLARPMFGILLIAFFAALAGAMGAADNLAWLLWVPPLTPFMLLLTPTGELSTVQNLVALGLTALGAIVAGGVAARSLAGPKSGRQASRSVAADGNSTAAPNE